MSVVDAAEVDSANPSLEIDPADMEIAMDPFKLWCSKQGLKDTVVAALIDEGFDQIRTVALMQEEDISALNIPQKGQIRLLQAAVKKAADRDNVPDTLPAQQTLLPPRRQTTLPTGMSIDALFNQLPETVHEQLTPARETTFSKPEFDPAYHLVAGKTSAGSGKPLEIVDFIGLSAKIDYDSEQVVSEIGEGSSLILKTGGKRPKFDSITIWQWALGAIRIQDELVRLGKLPTEESKRHYLGYCCKILEFNSRFEWSSILHFDREYRGQQARFNFPWGTEVPHLSSVQLRDKKQTFTNTNKKGKQFPQSRNGKQNICRDYNRDKCTFANCKYLHQCSVDGCEAKHPAVKHTDLKN